MLGKRCHVQHLGLVEYGEALALQERLVSERQAGESGDTLVLLQHPPVITLGRRGDLANILVSQDTLKEEGIALYEANRGGDVTYHGPGQLVGYPILRLADHGNDVYRYLRMLEEAITLCLRGYGIQAEQQPGYTGVWIGRDKIAAIGVAVKGGVTMHGFALNVAPNLAHFRLIYPCGYTDRGVTSIATRLRQPPDIEAVQRAFPKCFGRVFGTRMVEQEPDAEGAT
ncbi:MAG: lipoyl(octanoyl) transferase LipB [Dehalococcoidia bacterium]|nr:lipoyl(octanoyl) transferase LipB [Dehalococcoidia bacterium]